MAGAARSEGLVELWRRWSPEQRVAAVGAALLIVSTFGPFSFVEAAIVLVGLSVLLLLRRRGQGREFHLPFGDGIVIAAAGLWSGILIVIRLFDRPLGQGLLALCCAAILVLAGLRERQKQPPDDVRTAPHPDRRERPRPERRVQRIREQRPTPRTPGVDREDETLPFPEGPLEYRPPGAPEQEKLPGLEDAGEQPTTRLPREER